MLLAQLTEMYTKLHTKYQGFRPCGFRQEDFSCVYYIKLLSKIFIDSDFVIIIYIPYTRLSVCNEPVLCSRYDLCLLHMHDISSYCE